MLWKDSDMDGSEAALQKDKAVPANPPSSGQLYQGSKPTRDREYLRFIKRLPCVACLRTWWIDPAHTGPHALRQKASDLDTIPLCRRCHAEYDAAPYKFVERHKLNIPALIQMFPALLRNQIERTCSMTIDELIGKTLTAASGEVGGETILFTAEGGAVYQMAHRQDCCESVQIEDICGDLQDLVGSPIVSAKESCSDKNPEGITLPDYQDSFTWTFYRIATAKGLVVIRWYGESNGYYSEDVEFEKVQ